MLCAMLPINFSLFSGLNAIINWKLLSLKTLKISHFPDSMIVHLLFYGSIHFANQCHTSLCSCVFFLFMFTTLNSLVLPCASLITLLSVSFWSLHYLSGSWWWTGRPGVLQFMGSQRVGHDWVTELNWTEFICLWLKLGHLFVTEN